MSVGVKVDLGPGHIVLDRNPAPPKVAQQNPRFGPCLLWSNGRPFQLLLSTCLSSIILLFYCCATSYGEMVNKGFPYYHLTKKVVSQ